MKKIFFFALMSLSLVLAACGTQAEASKSCAVNYWLRVDGINGQTLKDYKLSGKATWTGPDSQGAYNLVLDNPSAWQPAFDEANNIMQKVNQGLTMLYASKSFIKPLTYSQITVPTSMEYSGSTDYCPDYSYHDSPDLEIGSPFGQDWNNSGYITSTRVGIETTYVSVKSPGDSVVNYSYPTKFLDTIYAYALGNGPALTLSPQIITPVVNPANPQDYGQKILNDMVNADQNGQEVLSFALSVDDFEGRQELKAVMAKALYIAGSEQNGPVMASMHAMLASGQKAVGSATAEGDGISIHGWAILGSGTLDGSGGGFQYQQNSSSWFEDLLKGSIYITPVNQ